MSLVKLNYVVDVGEYAEGAIDYVVAYRTPVLFSTFMENNIDLIEADKEAIENEVAKCTADFMSKQVDGLISVVSFKDNYYEVDVPNGLLLAQYLKCSKDEHIYMAELLDQDFYIPNDINFDVDPIVRDEELETEELDEDWVYENGIVLVYEMIDYKENLWSGIKDYVLRKVANEDEEGKSIKRFCDFTKVNRAFRDEYGYEVDFQTGKGLDLVDTEQKYESLQERLLRLINE